MAGLVIPLMTFKATQSCEQSLVEQHAHLQAHLSETLQGLGEVLVYDSQSHHQKIYHEQCAALTHMQNKLGFIASLSQSLVACMASVTVVGVMLVSALLFKNAQIEPPDFALLVLLSLASFDAVSPMSAALQGLGAVQRAAQRLFDIADQKPTCVTRHNPAPISQNFSLNFDNVSFAYQKEQQPVLSHLSFSMKAGEKIAIIGPTGAGKSSLVNVLMRFWDVDDGHIFIGDKDIKDVDLQALRAQFSVMPQKPYLFAGTIRDNLHLANPQASQADIEEACYIAGIHDFITALPDGYDTFVGENGHALSGGQVKRIALAQALLKKAPCLILDEPAEGLDYAMEADILSRVIKHLDETALILITHRHVGIDRMNQVITLKA